MKKRNVRRLTEAAMIAALYVVLVMVFNYFSFGFVQFRIAEVLTILPYFTISAIPGLFVGCIIANILGGAIWADVLFGSLATLLGAMGSYMLRRYKWLVPVCPVLANTLIVPFVLKYGYGAPEGILYMMVTIGISETIVCFVLGLMLLKVLQRYKKYIFK